MLSILKFLSRYSSKKLFFELIYFFKNPWNLNSREEVYRYEYLNNFLIKKNKNKIYSNILEIGCGEGIHTSYLTNIANKITSLDISKVAIEKAKKKHIKNVEFHNCIIEKYITKEKYDLIIASEVIYYIKDIKKFIHRIESFKTNYIITYYSKENHKLRKFFNNNSYDIKTFNAYNQKWFLIFK